MNGNVDHYTAISAIVLSLYEFISFSDQKPFRREKLRKLFTDRARLVNANGSHFRDYTLDDFLDEIEAQINRGHLRSFHECEVWQETRFFGRVAHRVSTYAYAIGEPAGSIEGYGLNSIQLLLGSDGWQVCSIIWNDENEGSRLPPEVLPQRIGTGN